MLDPKPQPAKYDFALRELQDVLNHAIDRHYDGHDIVARLQKRIRELENLRSLEIAKGMMK